MNEMKCPHCGGMFTIDEAGFAAILKQVRDAEFDKEVRAATKSCWPPRSSRPCS